MTRHRQIPVDEVLHDAVHRRRLEGIPHDEAFLDLGIRQVAHMSPLVREERHQTLRRQREERLADGCAARAELTAEIRLHEAGPRRERAVRIRSRSVR
jgi:hypothetical protein